ncbi:MAG: transketolase C-terminal domain-containing protein [Gammaproteobacteria bacterium]
MSDPQAPFQLGRAAQLRAGDDLAIIACGAMVALALRAADSLRQAGIAARVLNLHTIKPLDRDAILAAAHETRGIVTAEEHRASGGLGGAVAELLAVERLTRMRMIAMPDVFASIGPTGALRAKYGMSAEAIAEACRALLDAK